MRRWKRGMCEGRVLIFLGLVFLAGLTCAADSETVPLETLEVRVRLASAKTIEIRSGAPVTVRSAKGSKELPAGVYVVDAASVTPPGRRYHLFIKTFRPSQGVEAREYMKQWKAQAYSPEVVMFGKKFSSGSNVVIDNRRQWISVGRFDTEKQAEAMKTQLEAQKVFGWIMPETVGQGAATMRIASGGNIVAQGAGPLTFRSSEPLEVAGIDRGFWNPHHVTMSFAGTLEAGPGVDGLLNLTEVVPVEQYLEGVLPAEMPASWPTEALKAQAVAARTEVLSALGGKHMLEGYDFCATEHCRSYGACAGRQGSTDEAVAGTRGEVLIRGGRFAATVFSANCGGRSENNEAVWSAPADETLRSVSDVKTGKKVSSWREVGVEKWLKRPPASYCDHRNENFRWTRRFSAGELSGIVNKKCRVGQVKRIELLERGPGGRLTAVKIVGTGGTEVVKKELNIRLAFGGLPSAMFMVETRGPGRSSDFTFIGGGRGHGVGMCQDGACGMAAAGKTGYEILRHYFSNVDITRLH